MPTPVRNAVAALAAFAVLLAAPSCSSRAPILAPEPRSHDEYAQDRDLCVRKHTFGVEGAGSGPCLHCELFAFCMESHLWHVDPAAPIEGVPPCCRGTAEITR